MVWKTKPSAGGMQAFFVIWFGQMVSLIGSAMTRFALMVWAYQQTGSATTLALLGFFAFGSYVVLTPIAGIWVDRWDRRWVLIASDLGAGLTTIWVLALFATGNLQIWHLYVLELLTGAFEAFQIPAYNVSVTMLVPRQQLGRANGLRSLAFYGSRVLAPILAGIVLAAINVQAVLVIDVITFLIAMVTLMIVAIPTPPPSSEVHEEDTGAGFWQQIRFGTRYIVRRKGLLGLLLIFGGINFFGGLTYLSVMPAMILARTGGDELALASVQSALGIGGVIGGLILSAWGGPRRKIHGILAAAGISFFMGDLLFAVGQSTPVWIVAALVAAVFIPSIIASNHAIWQSKVPASIQGRVLSTAAAWRELPIVFAYLIAGPLADHVFEPAMLPGGALANSFGWLVGTGAGAGMGLMFVMTCIGGTLMSLAGYLFPPIRNVESDLPDYDEAAAQPPALSPQPDQMAEPVPGF